MSLMEPNGDIVRQLIEACNPESASDELESSIQLLDNSIFHSGNDEAVELMLNTVIRPLVYESRTEPVLMFHAYGWQYGGAERLISLIANYLTQRKYRVLIVVFEPIRNIAYKLDPSISFVPLYGDPERINRLLLLIDLIRPDLFIGHNNSIPELAAVYPQLRERDIRSIAYTLEYFFFPHRHPYLISTAIPRSEALEQATAACFLTRFSANAYGSAHPNAAIMQGAVSFDIQPVSKGRRGKTVLAVGRFSDEIKRLDRVLIAFRAVLDFHPDAKLLVVGPYNLEAHIPSGSPDTIDSLMKKLNLPASQIEFTGEQGRTELYYAQADVFILTSNSEGFPLVLTEAGSYGLPAVIVDIPGLEDMIVSGENGFIVPQDGMREMGERIADLFHDDDLWQRMSTKSQELISRYSIEAVGSRWEELIEVLLSTSSQEAVNKVLAERFMHEVDDPRTFARRMVMEYEQMAVQLAASSEPRALSSRLAAAEAAAGKIIRHWQTYGFRSMLYTAVRKLRSVLRKR